jgi:hypothetical protein
MDNVQAMAPVIVANDRIVIVLSSRAREVRELVIVNFLSTDSSLAVLGRCDPPMKPCKLRERKKRKREKVNVMGGHCAE